MFVELLWQKYRCDQILQALKIHPDENINDTLMTCLNGKLTLYHYSYAKMQRKKEIISIMTDYELIKIYDKKPSEYDQQVYVNAMCKAFSDMNYSEYEKKYRRNKRVEEKQNISKLQDESEKE